MKDKRFRNNKMPNNARYTKMTYKNQISNILLKELNMFKKSRRKNTRNTKTMIILHKNKFRLKN